MFKGNIQQQALPGSLPRKFHRRFATALTLVTRIASVVGVSTLSTLSALSGMSAARADYVLTVSTQDLSYSAPYSSVSYSGTSVAAIANSLLSTDPGNNSFVNVADVAAVMGTASTSGDYGTSFLMTNKYIGYEWQGDMPDTMPGFTLTVSSYRFDTSVGCIPPSEDNYSDYQGFDAKTGANPSSSPYTEVNLGQYSSILASATSYLDIHTDVGYADNTSDERRSWFGIYNGSYEYGAPSTTSPVADHWEDTNDTLRVTAVNGSASLGWTGGDDQIHLEQYSYSVTSDYNTRYPQTSIEGGYSLGLNAEVHTYMDAGAGAGTVSAGQTGKLTTP